MKDLLTKLRILKDMLGCTFDEWRGGVWSHDLDTPYCCPGRMQDECGCGGITWREIHTPAQGKPENPRG